MIGATLVWLLLQGDGWTASPSRPTVGDTIRLERTVPAPGGWRLRTSKLASGTVAEPLGDPAVVATAAGGWVVRHTVVAWTPGDITLDMPPIWRLGPDGTADSLSGGTAAFHVASVIPDSVRAPAPQPAVGPLRLARTSPIPAVVAVILAGGALLLLIAWRHRGRCPSGARGPRGRPGRALAVRRRAEGGGGASDPGPAARGGARDSRGARGAQHGGVSGGGRTGSAERAAARPA